MRKKLYANSDCGGNATNAGLTSAQFQSLTQLVTYFDCSTTNCNDGAVRLRFVTQMQPFFFACNDKLSKQNKKKRVHFKLL